MATIILSGWRVGLQKIALTKLQQELLQLPLKEAKQNVDRLLEGEKNTSQLEKAVLLNVPDAVAAEFVQRADYLGANVGFVKVDMYQHPTSNSASTAQQAA